VAPSERIVSMDLFRGYTVAGMVLVNFIDVFAVGPPGYAARVSSSRASRVVSRSLAYRSPRAS
jgi:uncharacterized membrane protein YeiB